jgi:hypothetical protein
MRAVRLSALTATATVAALAAVTGCTEKGSSGGSDRVINVTATDSKCEVSKKEFPAGHIELAIENKGSKVTEVYVLFPDDRVVTERENIGPGTKQTVTAEVKAGDYTIACKPGRQGHRRHRRQARPAARQGRRRLPHLRPGAGRRDPAARRDLRQGGQGRRHRGGQEGLRPLPYRLGAHRARRRVLR